MVPNLGSKPCLITIDMEKEFAELFPTLSPEDKVK